MDWGRCFEQTRTEVRVASFSVQVLDRTFIFVRVSWLTCAPMGDMHVCNVAAVGSPGSKRNRVGDGEVRVSEEVDPHFQRAQIVSWRHCRPFTNASASLRRSQGGVLDHRPLCATEFDHPAGTAPLGIHHHHAKELSPSYSIAVKLVVQLNSRRK